MRLQHDVHRRWCLSLRHTLLASAVRKRNGLHDFLVAADDDHAYNENDDDNDHAYDEDDDDDDDDHDSDDADKDAEDDENNDDGMTSKSLSMIMRMVVMVIFNQILNESMLGVSVAGPEDPRRSDRYCSTYQHRAVWAAAYSCSPLASFVKHCWRHTKKINR